MRGRRQAARACPHHKRHKAPSGSSGRGIGALVSRSPVGRGPERMMRLPSPPANRLADRRVAGRHAARMVRGLHCELWPITPISITREHPVRQCIFIHSCVGRMPRPGSASPPDQFLCGASQPDIECTNQSLPNFLAPDARNPRSPTSSSMALVGRGRLRLLPLAATVSPKFLPLGLPPHR